MTGDVALVEPVPLRVATLLGHGQVETALVCLASLLTYSAEPLRLRIHDDGSLTAADRERLAAELDDPEILGRPEAEERLADLLAGRPALAAFRRRNPLALKVVDAVLLAERGTLSYCDTDVLFLRPFHSLFRFAPSSGAFFMSDLQNAYSVRSWQLLRHRRLRLAARVNSGIVGFRTALYDPDLAEWFVARPGFRFAPVWEEQTLWALLGLPAGAHLLAPRRIRLPGSRVELDEDLVALHFVSPRRSLLPEVRKRAPDRRGEAPVEVGSSRAARLSPLALLGSELRRRLGRWR